MFILFFLLSLVIGFVFALIEAIFIWWLFPYTGIPYRPDYWQAVILAYLINIVLAFASFNVKIKD